MEQYEGGTLTNCEPEVMCLSPQQKKNQTFLTEREREEEDSLTTPETQPVSPTLPDTPVAKAEILETPHTSELSPAMSELSPQAQPTPQPAGTSNQTRRSGRKQNKPDRYM